MRKSAPRSAPQNKGRATSGGGILGNKVVEPDRRKPLGSKTTQGHPPGAADQLGQSLGWKGTPFDQPTFRRPGEPELGNAVAQNVGKGGPGVGRTVYECGFQALHGTPLKGEKHLDAPDTKSVRSVGA